MDERTTVQIERKIRTRLKKCRKYPRETYNDQLKRLMDLEKKMLKKRSLQ